MSELSYKELQEKGVFDVPYRSFEYMQSQQVKIDRLIEKHSEEKRILHNVIEMNQAKIDELKNKYDAMYNAFIVADDCRKEWHESYMSARKERDELQDKYDELNNRATGIALDQMTTAKLNYELQGRINEALRHVVDHGGYDDLTHVISILKGNKDAN